MFVLLVICPACNKWCLNNLNAGFQNLGIEMTLYETVNGRSLYTSLPGSESDRKIASERQVTALALLYIGDPVLTQGA